MKITGWKMDKTAKTMHEAALNEVKSIMNDVAALAQSNCPVGHVTREGVFVTTKVEFTPRKGRGKGFPVSFQAKQWRGREPGSLKASIRRVERESRPGNVRVYAGNYKVWYAYFVEKGTVKMTPRPFLRNGFKVATANWKKRIEDAMAKVTE